MSAKYYEGGPAFPRAPADMDGWRDGALGMTLRDYFAAKAMAVWMQHNAAQDAAAVVLNHIGAGVDPIPEGGPWSAAEIAEWAYDQADAMLEAGAR
jgi:hypothetical protein